MAQPSSSDSLTRSHAWPLVLCLVGVDYFSTLAYLPSIAVEAAGLLAPIAAGGVVLVTFLLALPVYWYVVGRSPDGRGAAGLLEDRVPGWRGKIIVLTLLGFAASDFVITRSLSLADAAVHLLHNPHGQRLLERLPAKLFQGSMGPWSPLELAWRVVCEPQVAVTIGLAIASFGLWHWLRRGFSRRMLLLAAGAVGLYLALAGLVIISGLAFIARRPEIWRAWLDVAFAAPASSGDAAAGFRGWGWSWLRIALWSFPQLALGVSGFEMTMTIVPRVHGGEAPEGDPSKGRVRNTRKLMLTAASIMAVYLVSAVLVTTLLAPHGELGPGGAAEHRALAYLAHGSTLAGGQSGAELCPLFGHHFGDLFDLSSVLILCLAGASVTLGLQNLLPHYLHRLGMEVNWAGRVGVILHVLNFIVLVVTVVFRASPSSQQWAYATSVLMLLAGATLAATVDLARTTKRFLGRAALLTLSLSAGMFFLGMTGLTVAVHPSGLMIAMAFVSAIVVSSFVSRWIRSTELRFEGLEFADDATFLRWTELRRSGAKVLVPHRPGLISLREKSRELQRVHRIDPAASLIFIEARLGDPSNFYQRPYMSIEREEELEVIRVSRCVSISHVLAAICLELCHDGDEPPEIIFGWSNESPIAANLNFLLLGQGNIPWMVRELLRRAAPDATRQPRVRIG
jgi:hypothetical protein